LEMRTIHRFWFSARQSQCRATLELETISSTGRVRPIPGRVVVWEPASWYCCEDTTTQVECRGKIRETKLRRHQAAPYMISGRFRAILTRVAGRRYQRGYGVWMVFVVPSGIMNFSAVSSRLSFWELRYFKLLASSI
jgi:hypothetical protein